MKHILALGLATLVVAGCGSHDTRFGDLRVTASGLIAVHLAAQPHFEGPGPNVRDVAFASPRVGVVVTSQYGKDVARIQRTVDGGDTWHDVWHGRGATTFAWVSAAPRSRVYAGALGRRGRPALFVSRDAGRTWTKVRPRFPRLTSWDWLESRAVFVTPSFGYTLPDPANYGAGAFLRTRDGGRTWRRLWLPKYTAAVQFLDVANGFAVGGSPCNGTVWRTNDAGASWARILCENVPLGSVQFLDSRRGFVGGGWAPATEQTPSAVLFATSDGGSTWSRRFADARRGYRGGTSPLVDLRFLDAARGWARTGECKCCPSGPCAGDVLVTRDGGRTWARREEEVQLATVGARNAWAVRRCEDECQVVWRTRDAGRTWQPLAREDLLQPGGVSFSGNLVTLVTAAGHFASPDGVRWHPTTQRFVSYTLSSVAVIDARHADALPASSTYLRRCKAELTHGLRETSDGGRTWTPRRAPFGIASLAATRGVLAVVGVRLDCTNLLGLSDDGGHTWRVQKLPRRDCIASVARDDVWLGCGRTALVSRDRGRTWTRLDGTRRRFNASRVAAAGRGRAWALFSTGGPDRLWHTTDSGRTWVEQWPRLPTP